MIFILIAVVASLNSEELDVEFRSFISKFSRPYKEGTEEFYERFKIFEANIIRAEELNKIDPGVHGITKFMDLTPAEFKKYHLGYKRDEINRVGLPLLIPSNETAPTSFDWRKKGAITEVKDQGDCGSCWAFSAVEEVESTWFLNGNSLTNFSPQQVVSCDKVDQGCDGGDTLTAYKYIEKTGGLTSKMDYPYKSGRNGKTGKCIKKDVKIVGGRVKSMEYATKPCNKGACRKQDEKTLQKNLAQKAPVSICVNAEKWQTYKRGVLSSRGCGSHSSKSLDHCVQLVGYGSSAKEGYWIVRNSWNTDWGVKGYIYLQMGQNACGVANEATITDYGSDGKVKK